MTSLSFEYLSTLCFENALSIFWITDKSNDFYKIWHTTYWGNMLQMFSAVMKRAMSSVRATVRYDLVHVHKLRCPVPLYLCSIASSTRLINLPWICHIMWWRAVDSFLHHSPNAVIDHIQVQAVGQPHPRSSEFQSFTMKQLHWLMCMVSQCIVLLKDVKFIVNALDDSQ